MQKLQGTMFGFSPIPGAAATTVAPGMGGLLPDLYPGVIVDAKHAANGAANAPDSVGKIGLTFLGISVLTLVLFNVTTKGYHG